MKNAYCFDTPLQQLEFLEDMDLILGMLLTEEEQKLYPMMEHLADLIEDRRAALDKPAE